AAPYTELYPLSLHDALPILHLSFDLCDRAAGIETVFDLLLKRYDRDSLRPYGAASEVLEKVASLGRTEDFRREIEALQQQHKAGDRKSTRLNSSHVSIAYAV